MRCLRSSSKQTFPSPPGNSRERGTRHGVDKKVSADLILRAGLRSLVVAFDPVRSRPPPPAHRGLRAFPRGARRAGYHPRQDRGGGVTAPDGAVARRAEMVRGGPLAPRGDFTYRSSVQCPVGPPSLILSA